MGNDFGYHHRWSLIPPIQGQPCDSTRGPVYLEVCRYFWLACQRTYLLLFFSFFSVGATLDFLCCLSPNYSLACSKLIHLAQQFGLLSCTSVPIHILRLCSLSSNRTASLNSLFASPFQFICTISSVLCTAATFGLLSTRLKHIRGLSFFFLPSIGATLGFCLMCSVVIIFFSCYSTHPSTHTHWPHASYLLYFLSSILLHIYDVLLAFFCKYFSLFNFHSRKKQLFNYMTFDYQIALHQLIFTLPTSYFLM